MTFDSALFDPIRLVVPIAPGVQTQAWEQRQSYTAHQQWTGYLNALCLHTLLPLLREEEPRIAPATTTQMWEFVNGTALRFGPHRAVLIPVEAIDLDEVRIPQEWVDIPSWAADYYIPVQVNPDDQWIRVAGFVTHRQLKATGEYDGGDRTYTLGETDLIPDFNALWVSRVLAPDEATRSPLPAVAPLPLEQAQSLLQRLAQPSVILPRLRVPFSLWAGLMQHGGWRQDLSDRRQGLPDQHTVRQWLRSGLSTLAQRRGWQTITLQPEAAAARGEGTIFHAGLSRTLTIAGQPYEFRLLPLVELGDRTWRFALRPLTPGGRIPGGVTLRLLTEALQPFEGNADTAAIAVDELYVDVALEPGEGLVWEIDPTPEGYEQEILRF